MTTPDDVGVVSKSIVADEAFSFYANPAFWLGKAEELNMAALALHAMSLDLIANRQSHPPDPTLAFRHFTITPFPPDPKLGAGIWQTMMMAGFALENVLKALFIRTNPSAVKSGKLEGFNHDLVPLAASGGISLSDVESRLCELCTHAMVCAGRYPTSLKAKDLAIEWRIDLTAAWSVYTHLYDRLFAVATK